MAANFEHMQASHGEFVSFWLAAVAVIGVVALAGFIYLTYRDWQSKRLRREERRQRRHESKRKRKHKD